MTEHELHIIVSLSLVVLMKLACSQWHILLCCNEYIGWYNTWSSYWSCIPWTVRTSLRRISELSGRIVTECFSVCT